MMQITISLSSEFHPFRPIDEWCWCVPFVNGCDTNSAKHYIVIQPVVVRLGMADFLSIVQFRLFTRTQDR